MMRSVGMLFGSARILISGVLCLLMVEQPMVAAAAPASVSKKAVLVRQIQGEDRVLHALNRFTFGPRPGDVEAVRAIGLKAWFEP